ncbi:MAG: aldolase/citrate lyase family protein [Chloroflexota bacterium]
MYPNPLKQKIKSGELIFGTVLPAPSPRVATAVCGADIDFLWIDTEHAPFGMESIETIPALVRQTGVAPLIRVAWNDPSLIKKAYDVGAVAVMVPQVNTAEEAAKAVEYAFYPPLGQRGVSPNWPHLAGENWMDVIKTANQETVLFVQIESEEAYNNLDEIAAVPGIDVLFVGPMDLSASLGVITETRHEKVLKVMEDVPKRMPADGPKIATTLVNIDEMQEKFRWGYTVMNVGSPLGYGVQALNGHIGTLKENPMGK